VFLYQLIQCSDIFRHGRLHKHFCYGSATIISIFIVVCVRVFVNNIKGFGVATKIKKNRLLYHCCRTTGHFVLLLRIIIIKYDGCLSVFLPQLSGMQIALSCLVYYCEIQPVWLYHIFSRYFTNGPYLKYVLNIDFFLFLLQILSEKFFIQRRIQQSIIINVWLHLLRFFLSLLKYFLP
jgi:hypothetical protein